MVNYYHDVVTEEYLGGNYYGKYVINSNPLTVGSWSNIATLSPSIYKNLRIDFGKSYMINQNNNYILPIDSANGTSAMIRLNIGTGAIEGYSATLSGNMAHVYVIYTK